MSQTEITCTSENSENAGVLSLSILIPEEQVRKLVLVDTESGDEMYLLMDEEWSYGKNICLAEGEYRLGVEKDGRLEYSSDVMITRGTTTELSFAPQTGDVVNILALGIMMFCSAVAICLSKRNSN